MIQRFLTTVMFSFIMVNAWADYRFIVPQDVGQGTDIWARIVAKELEKKLGEKIIIENIPGANDIPGFNKFHNSLRFDNKAIMVSHGGNAESYLVHKVDYSYNQYEPVGLQNLTVMVGRKNDSDVYTNPVKFAAASGTNPDVMAMVLLVCGPNKTIQEYKACYDKNFKYVKGMGAGERRAAFMRGELNVARETTSAYFKVYRSMKENADWFNHGVLDIKTGKTVADTNFQNETYFSTVFKQKWGVEPKGDLYDSYLLAKTYRDVLQKALFVNKGNPNADKLRKALKEMLDDPLSMQAIEKETGKYQWLVGNEVNKAFKTLEKLTTRKALKDLVWWGTVVLGQEAFYKDEIAKIAN